MRLNGHTSRNMEVICAEVDLNSGVLSQEVSEKRNFIMLPGDHSCNVLTKNVASFCLCPEDRSEID